MKRVIATALSGFVLLGAGFCVGSVPAVAGSVRFERFSYAGWSQEPAQTGKKQYRNPILPGYYPDPSILRVDKDYYLINSSFSHFPGLPIFHSRDLVSWTQIANAIDRPGQLDFSGREVSDGVYAPDITYHDGLYYVVNTCVRCGGNFVITAKNPAGPWSDPVWFAFDGIDPSLFWDGDKAYLVNNGEPNEPARYSGHRAIWMQEFDYKNLKLVGERIQIVNGGTDIAKQPSWIEGPHILKHGKYYYLVAAEGGTGENHSQVAFRAKSVRGPYVPYAGNPILTQRDLDPHRANPITSAGHADLVQTKQGSWWAVFLATRPYSADLRHYNIGRETFMLPVRWRKGWPIILSSGKPIPFTVNKPKLPADPAVAVKLNGDFSYTEEFDDPKLAMSWIGIRTPKAPFYRLDGGALVLESGAALGDKSGVPAFIGRRQQHHIATVSTTLNFAPIKNGDRAGLAAFQNDRAFLFFGVTEIDGKPAVALYVRKNATEDTLIASAPIAGGPVTLTMRADCGAAAFDYIAGGKTVTLKAGVDISFLSTASAGGFVGTVIGPYAYAP